MVAQGLGDSGTPRKRIRRSKAEMEADAAQVPPVKRRRGRPRKTEAVTPGGESGGDGVTPQKDADPNKPKRQRKKKGEIPIPSAVDVSLIGQQVTGVLDGSFDAGYLLSVRVGNTDTVLRGVVFGPGLSVPLSKINDVAPSVKHVRRDEKITSPPKPIGPPPLPFVATLPVVLPTPLPAVIPPTSAVLEAAAAVFTNPATSSTVLPTTGLSAALSQLPGGGYTPEPSTYAHVTYQSDNVPQMHVDVQSGA